MDELERLKRVFYDYTTELQVCENITCNIRAEVIDRHELTVKIALECMVHYLKKNNIECKYPNSYRYIIRKAIEYELITNKNLWKQIGMDLDFEHTDEFEQLCYFKKICEQYVYVMDDFIKIMSEKINTF